MTSFLQDAMHAARLFHRSPGFTLGAVLTVGLGIAANTAMFSVVDAVLLKPIAFRDPARVVMFQNTYRRAPRSGSAAATEFNWWRRQTAAFEDVSAYAFQSVNLTGGSDPQLIPAMKVSADYFHLRGVRPALGRTFISSDDAPGAPKTVVLAWSFWQRRFAADRSVIGRILALNGERYEVIGVAGRALEDGQIAEQSLLSGDIEIDDPPEVYLPFQIDPSSADRGHGFNVAGRLKPGVTLAAANEQLRASYPEYARQYRDLFPGAGFAVQPLQSAIVSGVRQPLLILLAAVGLVLLIACANFAGLLLARAGRRCREIAIRAAIGAGRGRIVRQLLTENLMLSLAGGALGLASGYAGIRALLLGGPGIPRVGSSGVNVSLDWRIAGFSIALALFTGLIFGLAPAFHASRADLAGALKQSAGAGRRHGRARSLLVTAEMALAIVLLIGAALLIRSFLAVGRVNPGFDPRNVLTMRMSITGPPFADPDVVARLMNDGLRRLRTLPGVEAAAAACCVPLDSRLQVGFRIDGRGPDSGGVTGWVEVSAGYFETFRIPILRGRAFGDRDENGPAVAIINQALANRFWPGGDPLDAQIHLGDSDPIRIVGIAGDLRDRGLDRDIRPTLYVPSITPGGLLRLMPWAWMVRTRGTPQALISTIREQLRDASGGLPVGQVRTMEEIVSRSQAARRFQTLVLSVFGLSALLLAAVGIYGLMAHSIAQRRHEIGIRLALGAEPRRILKMVFSEGLRLAAAGAVCGLAAAYSLTRWLAAFLFDVQPRDPLVFCTVPLILSTVAVAAVWLPARRAAGVEPARALRHE